MPSFPSVNIFAEVSDLPDNNGAIPLPLSHNSFSFDSFGVAGFFGGDSSVAGMATVSIIPGRRWVGWYNNPGSYEVAKKYGPLGKNKLFDGIFPDGEHDPARLFKLDGREGPQFVGAHSGTVFQRTGHLGHLITSKAADMRLAHEPFRGKNGRLTVGPTVTIVNMQHVFETGFKERSQPPLPPTWTAAWSVVPIAVSISAWASCALVGDWFCFASIAVGIVAHGLACVVIGSGKLTFTHPKPAPNAPAGDGVLKGDRDWVILVGAEGAVNAFTRGRFLLQYGPKKSDKERDRPEWIQSMNSNPARRYRQGSSADTASLLSQTDQGHRPASLCSWIPPQSLIGACAVLLMVQFIGQLLVIPHGTLFGQIMFIATVFASWMYNTFLSAIDRDELQMRILMKELQLSEETHMHKYELNTFTATIAFTCFALAAANCLKDPLVFLDAMLPNNTVVWKTWKKKMAKKLKTGAAEIRFSPTDLDALDAVAEDARGGVPEGTASSSAVDHTAAQATRKAEIEADRALLETFFRDAEDAWDAWSQVRNSVFPRSSRGRR